MMAILNWIIFARHTSSKSQRYGVGQEQQGVVEKTLEHRSLHASFRQILAGHSRPTDQHGQQLTQRHSLH